MKHLLFFLWLSAIFCDATGVYAQTPTLAWESTYQGPLAVDQGRAIVVDNQGNSYVTGRSDSTGTITDCITIKYDAFGKVVWKQRWSRPGIQGIDEGLAITLDQSKNVYVTGKTQKSSLKYEFLTIKYDSTGAYKWHKIRSFFANNAEEEGRCIITDQFGDVYVLGNSSAQGGKLIKYNTINGNESWTNPVSLGSAASSYHKTRAFSSMVKRNHKNRIVVPGSDGDIIEIDYNGNKVHTYEFRPENEVVKYEMAMKIVLDDNDDVYSQIEVHGTNQSQTTEVYTCRYKSETNTNPLGWRTFGNIFMANGLCLDNDYNIYALVNHANGSSDQDFFIRKYSTIPKFDTLWRVYYDGIPSGINYNSVSINIDNDANPTNICISGYGAGNIFALVLDSMGKKLWDTTYNCPNNGANIASKMVRDQFGSIYITGSSNCNNQSDDIKTLKYCLFAPPRPTPMTGDTVVCVGTSHTFSVSPVSGVNYYTWESPDGWIGTSITNSIQLQIGNNAVTGDITVRAYKDFCPSEPRILHVEVKKIPEAPAAILGSQTVCSGSDQEYSINKDDNADGYTWTAPDGSWSGTSLTDVIQYQAGNIGGQLVVVAHNVCGESSPQTIQITVNPTPSAPATITGPDTLCYGKEGTFSVDGEAGLVYNWKWPATEWNAPTTGTSVTTLFVGKSGTVEVTASDGFCTSAVQTKYVHVFEPVAKPVLTAGEYYCQGDTITINVAPDDNVTDVVWNVNDSWTVIYSSNQSIAVLPAGSGIVKATASNLCFNSEATEKQITAINDVEIETVNDHLHVPIDGAIYQWISCDPDTSSIEGANNQDFTPVVSGYYAVKIIKDGCIVTTDCVHFFTSVSNNYLQPSQLKIFPNPANEQVNIEYDNGNIETVTVLNSLGLKIHEIRGIHNSTVSIPISLLPPGMYALLVNTPKGMIVGKVIKE